MKTIFYAISILVIAAAAFFSFSNSGKIKTQIDAYTEARDTKRSVEQSIAETQADLDDTKHTAIRTQLDARAAQT